MSRPAPRAKRVGWAVLLGAAVLVLLALAWLALDGGIRQLPVARTPGQRVETAVQLLCGVLTLLVLVTSFQRRVTARAVRIAWAGSLAAAAGLSALVWGPPMPVLALLFAVGGWLLARGLLLALDGSWQGLRASPRRPERG